MWRSTVNIHWSADTSGHVGPLYIVLIEWCGNVRSVGSQMSFYNGTCLVTAITESVTWGSNMPHTRVHIEQVHCGTLQLYQETFEVRTAVSIICNTLPVFTVQTLRCAWTTRTLLTDAQTAFHAYSARQHSLNMSIGYCRGLTSGIGIQMESETANLREKSRASGTSRTEVVSQDSIISLSAYLGDTSAARSVSLWFAVRYYEEVPSPCCSVP